MKEEEYRRQLGMEVCTNVKRRKVFPGRSGNGTVIIVENEIRKLISKSSRVFCAQFRINVLVERHEFISFHTPAIG